MLCDSHKVCDRRETRFSLCESCDSRKVCDRCKLCDCVCYVIGVTCVIVCVM